MQKCHIINDLVVHDSTPPKKVIVLIITNCWFYLYYWALVKCHAIWVFFTYIIATFLGVGFCHYPYFAKDKSEAESN